MRRDPGGLNVSVVVPSYNEGSYLAKTVHSLLTSLPADGEIIVVDDCSTDGSAGFLPDRDARVRCIRPASRLGAVAARNFGAEQARGEILVFSDAHITVSDAWADEFTAILRRPEVGVAGAVIADMEHPTWKGYGLRFVDDGLRCEWGPRQDEEVFAVPLIGAGFMAMRRSLFEALEGFDVGMLIYGMEDPDLDMRVWTYGYQCVIVRAVEAAHLFRMDHSFQSWEGMVHNILRLGTVHFGQERLGRLIAEVTRYPGFAAACSRIVGSDVWTRRDRVRAIRQYDDDWYFERFPMGDHRSSD
jgi:glycosyltransferase involved in cell wall biosynthesis